MLKEAIKKAGMRACHELSLSRRSCEQEALCDALSFLSSMMAIQRKKLCELLALREQGDPTALRKRAQGARYKLMDLLYYLQANLRSLIDYRSWQLAGRRISTGFVESTINRIVGRRMCKGQQMRWSRLGAHCLVQVRAALLNQELDEIAHCQFPWLGEQRISWPWQQTSHSF